MDDSESLKAVAAEKAALATLGGAGKRCQDPHAQAKAIDCEMISLRLRGKGPAGARALQTPTPARVRTRGGASQPAPTEGDARSRAPRHPARPGHRVLRGEVASPPAAAGDFFTGPGLETRAGSERALLPASFKPSAAAINSHATATAHGAAAARPRLAPACVHHRPRPRVLDRSIINALPLAGSVCVCEKLGSYHRHQPVSRGEY